MKETLRRKLAMPTEDMDLDDPNTSAEHGRLIRSKPVLRRSYDDTYALFAEHAARATPSTPLAWVRHESNANISEIELRLSLWPGGNERHFGMGHPHGRRITWF